MVGNYVTNSREFTPLIPSKVTRDLGFGKNELVLKVVPESQTVRSWRTRAEGVEQQAELENDLRIFRNGFTSYDPVYDRGHEFLSTRTRWWLSHRDSYITNVVQSRNTWTRGPLIPVFFVNNGMSMTAKGYDPYPKLPADSDIVSLGQTAILNVAPTAPNVPLSQDVGEALSELLPGVPGAATLFGGPNVLRSAGAEYLNIQFGWAPLLKDLRAAMLSLGSASRTIQQLQRDSGRQVRRRFRFPPSVTSTESTYGTDLNGPYVGHDPSWYTGGSTNSVQKLTRTDRNVWFSGAFTYYVPRDETLLSTLQMYEQRANKLLGTRFNVSTLWELAPWSWLIDWKLKIGEAIGAASLVQEDGLVIRYGYLMVHTIEDHTYNSPPGLKTLTGVGIPNASVSFRRETKRRYRATPYGFGVSETAFTGSQIAILTALGLSRTPAIKF